MDVRIISDPLGVWIEWPGSDQTAAETGCIIYDPGQDADAYIWLPSSRWKVVAYSLGEVLAARDLQTGSLFSWDLKHYECNAIVVTRGAEGEDVYVAAPV